MVSGNISHGSIEAQSTGRQTQFLDVSTRDEAAARFEAALDLRPLGIESRTLLDAVGRTLAKNVVTGIDVPGFDRSNVDGFAVRSGDLLGAEEEHPQTLLLTGEILSPGVVPQLEVLHGQASVIATGGMLPRGADAVVMVEQSEPVEIAGQRRIAISRMVTPGSNVSFAGSDMTRGETVLWSGQLLTAREVGVLAALGIDRVDVYRPPRVAIISTGDEIVPPGQCLPLASVYDSNATILAATVRELGGEPICLGTVHDDLSQLRHMMQQALAYDMVLLSGGTSKGEGDLSYQVVREFTSPGIVVHGVALKPGKPICLAVTHGKPVVVLPGFPTSAIFTFHEFVAPVLRQWSGQRRQRRHTLLAQLPIRINSERGRTEYVLVGLVRSSAGWAAYPMGKGSGSVTTFSAADGFITIPQQTEFLDEGTPVEVTLLDQAIEPADLVVIGSHCTGLDLLLGEMRSRGYTTRSLTVGSQGGLSAVKRGECDIAGVHLYSAQEGEYNRPFLTPGVGLLHGYQRQQCFVFRSGDPRFEGANLSQAIECAITDRLCQMINRNPGSGTRILIDELLSRCTDASAIPGYRTQPKSHNAVATAVSQGRADWGVTIESVAREYQLATIPIRTEHYDFLVPEARQSSPAVMQFASLLNDPKIIAQLVDQGLLLP